MELDQLKTVWQKTTQQQVEGYFISADEVRSLIKKRSNTAVAQIKRGVRNKVFMAGGIGLMMTLFSVFIFTEDEPVFSFSESISNVDAGIFYLVFGLVICFVSVFNAFCYKQIIDVEKDEQDMKSSIKRILIIIRKAVRAKIYSDTAVLPATVLSIALIDFMRGFTVIPNATVFGLAIAGAIAFAVFSYFLTSYGQKKRYGQQISALEECLQELNEEGE